MKFLKPEAELFIPDGVEEAAALGRITDLCVGAHQDDTEIMAFSPAAACYGRPDRYFANVTVTDGAGSPRAGLYADYTNDQMKTVRIKEQKAAAVVGGYAAQFLLAHPSSEVKHPRDDSLVRELAAVIDACSPHTVYTHNLADKHDTHVAVALRTIAALRLLPPERRPKKVYSLEVWRGLDWLCDDDKSVFDTSGHPNLAAALLGVYDSQIAGGKRYDAAAIGRRLANATFFASHDTDKVESASYGLDITPLVEDPKLEPEQFIQRYIDRFAAEVRERIAGLGQ